MSREGSPFSGEKPKSPSRDTSTAFFFNHAADEGPGHEIEAHRRYVRRLERQRRHRLLREKGDASGTSELKA